MRLDRGSIPLISIDNRSRCCSRAVFVLLRYPFDRSLTEISIRIINLCYALPIKISIKHYRKEII